MTLAPSRPLVRYHGGKWMIAPWVISHFPPHRCYVEPFGGGASVLLRKPRSHAEVYNDLDDEIVNLFRVVRDRGEDLRRAIELTPFARLEFDLSYEPVEDQVERARRTVVRSAMGFGSNFTRPTQSGRPQRTGFRCNSSRSGTTPARDWRNYPDALVAAIDRLRGVVIEHRDAIEVMRQHDKPTTLHYVDPPYLQETRDKGTDYRHEMTDDQHRELAAALNGLQGAVIVSGYPSQLYEELFAGWQRVERRALADGATPRIEVLWMRNVPSDLFTHHTEESA